MRPGCFWLKVVSFNSAVLWVSELCHKESLHRKVSEEVLAFLNAEGLYCVVWQESQDLAKAIQENLRRHGDKEGFSTDPEDCLAYKFYRYVRIHGCSPLYIMESFFLMKELYKFDACLVNAVFS